MTYKRIDDFDDAVDQSLDADRVCVGQLVRCIADSKTSELRNGLISQLEVVFGLLVFETRTHGSKDILEVMAGGQEQRCSCHGSDSRWLEEQKRDESGVSVVLKAEKSKSDDEW